MTTPRAVVALTEQTFLTELDAALHAAHPKRYGVLRNTALDHFAELRDLVVRFTRATSRHVKRENGLGKRWTPSLAECQALRALAGAMKDATAGEERVREMIAAERQGYTQEQLEAVWRDNLRRSATSWGAAEWWDLLRIGFGEDVARVFIRARWGEQVLAELEGS